MNCKHEFETGMALAPIMGSNDVKIIQTGDTISPVGGKFMPCLKCKLCGHSLVTEFPVRTYNPDAPLDNEFQGGF